MNDQLQTWWDGAFPITNEAGLLAVLLSVLAAVFALASHPTYGKVFKVVPTLVFCYFVPTLLTTLGIVPDESPLYSWIKSYVLPASLLLLIISLDLPGIVRLGPKAIIMMLAGTFGVVIGGPIALLICRSQLPPDAWQGMAALSGSWIGGGANMLAIAEQAGTSGPMVALMVVPDVAVSSLWMGALLFMAGRQHEIDARTGADARAIRELEVRLTEFQQRTTRPAGVGDLLMIIALAFLGGWLCYEAGKLLPEIRTDALGKVISAKTWKFVLITTLGIVLSLTRVRNLEGVGASKIGSVMLYLLVACIGASADFRKVIECPWFFVAGVIWLLVHIIVLLGVAWLIRAPVFFVAVGSQANIGGAASAPIVASAFHPSLAPVGALLAVAGYVLGTYAGLVCMHMLRAVSGTGAVP